MNLLMSLFIDEFIDKVLLMKLLNTTEQTTRKSTQTLLEGEKEPRRLVTISKKINKLLTIENILL